VGVVVEIQYGSVWKFKCHIDPKFSNNQVEYEVMIMSFRMLAAMVYDYDPIQVMGYSEIALKQIMREYKCLNPNLQ